MKKVVTNREWTLNGVTAWLFHSLLDYSVQKDRDLFEIDPREVPLLPVKFYFKKTEGQLIREAADNEVVVVGGAGSIQKIMEIVRGIGVEFPIEWKILLEIVSWNDKTGGIKAKFYQNSPLTRIMRRAYLVTSDEVVIEKMAKAVVAYLVGAKKILTQYKDQVTNWEDYVGVVKRYPFDKKSFQTTFQVELAKMQMGYFPFTVPGFMIHAFVGDFSEDEIRQQAIWWFDMEERARENTREADSIQPEQVITYTVKHTEEPEGWSFTKDIEIGVYNSDNPFLADSLYARRKRKEVAHDITYIRTQESLLIFVEKNSFVSDRICYQIYDALERVEPGRWGYVAGSWLVVNNARRFRTPTSGLSSDVVLANIQKALNQYAE